MRVNTLPISLNIMYKHGTNISVINVANITAKPSATAIGITNLACKLVSNIMGNTPANVVIEVSNIGLNRAQPASITAFLILTPVYGLDSHNRS